eukprot:TRINITY_DN1025_c0_g3_i3.p1 TRINITY_DN1025_c0_g3~~TRINITY_DN1025_c0_g3_i3.p1  ORF type:complete len:435 (+),score=81.18 TRINITY_DN1025_c0_g3_i3:44-1348(+)
MNGRESSLQKETKDSEIWKAIALQDHITKSMGLGSLTFNDLPGSKKIVEKPKAIVAKKAPSKPKEKDKEKANDVDIVPLLPSKSVTPPTLAEKMGIVKNPNPALKPLSKDEWLKIKKKSDNRKDSYMPCVICQDDFGMDEQVLLSCSHVFHKICLSSFERFSKERDRPLLQCPLCRKRNYQKALINEGKKITIEQSVIKIQSVWRGYKARKLFKFMKETIPPKSPTHRKAFYERKLTSLTDKLIDALDRQHARVESSLLSMDDQVAQARSYLDSLDTNKMNKVASTVDWILVREKALARGIGECPICLMQLLSVATPKPSHTQTKTEKLIEAKTEKPKPSTPKPPHTTTSLITKPRTSSPISTSPKTTPVKITPPPPKIRETSVQKELVILSCTHIFHAKCLNSFEDFNLSRVNVCPCCKCVYEKNPFVVNDNT